MKRMVDDIIWLEAPKGGPVKITMGGYSLEHVERVKKSYVDVGWVILAHKMVTQPKSTFWETFIRGAVFGASMYIIISFLFEFFSK